MRAKKLEFYVIVFFCCLLFAILIIAFYKEFTKNKVTENYSQNLYNRVIVVGIDGAGNFFQEADTPNFDRIFERGNITYTMSVTPPTMSAEGWGSMFYGVEPEVHGLVNDTAMTKRYINENLPSIIKLINQKYPNSVSASIVSWYPINYGIIDVPSGGGVLLYPDDKVDSGLTDDEVLSAAKSFINEYDPKFLFVHFNEVDEAGHKYGYGSSEYYAAITETDKVIGELYDGISRHHLLQDSLFIVTTDHGGTLEGTHGGDSYEETSAMFAIRGRCVETDTEITDMKISDIASIVLYALEIEQPVEYSGKIPKGIFMDSIYE